MTRNEIVDAIYRGNGTRAMEKRLLEEDRAEFIRLIRCRKIIARPEDFPDVPTAQWHSGTIILRGHGHALSLGDKVCFGFENYARLYEIDEMSEIEVEDEDERPTKVTGIHLAGVHCNGDYAIIPGMTAFDLGRHVVRMKLDAVKTICRYGEENSQ